MATRSKKGTPYEVGEEVWVRAVMAVKSSRLATAVLEAPI